MTLREELGERLYRVGNMMDEPLIDKDSKPPEWAVCGSMTRECWRSLADECIRQMEFARHECPFEWAGTPNPETFAGSPEAILRLAPEDWKP